MNKNADTLSLIRVKHLNQYAKLQMKIFANNVADQEEQIPDEETQEPEINYQEIIDEFNSFFKTPCLIEYCEVEYIKKQLLDKIKKNILTYRS